MQNLAVLTLSLVPTVLICLYVFWMDQVEKEPLWLLGLLMAAGALGYIPARGLELAALSALNKVFSSGLSYSLTGAVDYASKVVLYIHHLLYSFVGLALVQWGIRWATLLLITWRSKEFDCLFDGVVYAVFASLGYSLFENISYVWRGGWGLLLPRILAFLPVQVLLGIVLGCLYSGWRLYTLMEAEGRRRELPECVLRVISARKRRFAVLSLLVPVLLYGCYCWVELMGALNMALIRGAWTVLLSAADVVLVLVFSSRDAYFTDLVSRRLSRLDRLQ